MPRIAVSANSLVDYSPERWRLIQVDDPAQPKLLVEAKTGLPLRYNGYFAVSRDLPESGEILGADLGQVVLGWSNESSSWQLGVTLSPEISLARSSRWFELLRFTHPDASRIRSARDSTRHRAGANAGYPLRLNSAGGISAGAGARSSWSPCRSIWACGAWKKRSKSVAAATVNCAWLVKSAGCAPGSVSSPGMDF